VATILIRKTHGRDSALLVAGCEATENVGSEW
jgi:hypothetical protein